MLKIGHRGAKGYAPENTLRSIRTALGMGVDGVEIDVHRCKSGEIVVIHDDTLERTTNGHGSVRDKTLQELKTLDAGEGETIPTLQEVLETLGREKILLVEIKDEAAALPAAAIVEEYIARGWQRESLWIIAFNHVLLREIRHSYPLMRTGALIVGVPVSLAACAQEAGAQALCPAFDHANAALIEDARARHLEIFAWTINSREKIRRAEESGVTGVMSDYPDLFTA